MAVAEEGVEDTVESFIADGWVVFTVVEKCLLGIRGRTGVEPGIAG